MELGSFIEREGRSAVRFERIYPHSIERVWAAVTDTDELAHWFPSRVVFELREGGEAEFSGDPNMPGSVGRVVVCDPPRRLGFTWGGDELQFELEALGDGQCRFTLTDFLESENAAARNAAGWSVCIGELDKRLAGSRADGPHSDTAAPWKQYYEGYIAAGFPHGAEIPGVS